MNAGQYEGLMARLGEILDRMPVPASPEPAQPVALTTHHLDGTKTKTLVQEAREGASLALYCLLVNLDGWIQGAKENHEALEHRGRENRGEECWRSFAPSDIRSMVNDVARELGLSEFPRPAEPEEDKAL